MSMPMMRERPVLTLAELERFDPQAGDRGQRRRFLCPLAACAGKQRDGAHRSLSVETAAGLWRCWRCGASGRLRERWEERPGQAVRAAARRAFALPQDAGAASVPEQERPQEAPQRPTAAFSAADRPIPHSREDRPQNRPQTSPAGGAAEREDWRAQLAAALDLAGGPGGRYVEGRGVPAALAAAAGVRFAPSWFGRPAVLFPLWDRAGAVVAVNGRYLDRAAQPKARTAGAARSGLFAAPGALTGGLLVVTEAPLDALSLAACGVPAVALCGTQLPEWLPVQAAFGRAALALDADAAGDAAALALAARFRALGVRVERWRPAAGCKDWNEALQRHGADALRANLAGALAGGAFGAAETWDEAAADALLAAFFGRAAAAGEMAQEDGGRWAGVWQAAADAYAARSLPALRRTLAAHERAVGVGQ